MSRVYYQIGFKDADFAFASVPTFDSIRQVAPDLPPGEYWIEEVRIKQRWHPSMGWVEDPPVYYAHASLVVRDREDWCLTTLAGAVWGPGYVIV